MKAGRTSQGVASWVSALFPEMPKEVLEGLLPENSWNSGRLPFNRRKRRSLLRSTNVLLHLFAGEQRWQAAGQAVLLEIDIARGSDLLDLNLFAFLASLGAQGSVSAIVGAHHAVPLLD